MSEFDEDVLRAAHVLIDKGVTREQYEAMLKHNEKPVPWFAEDCECDRSGLVYGTTISCNMCGMSTDD